MEKYFGCLTFYRYHEMLFYEFYHFNNFLMASNYVHMIDIDRY